LVASGIFHPESGGPATYLRAILPALQAAGWAVKVLSYGAPAASVDFPYPLRRIARRRYPLRRLQYGFAAWGWRHWADIVYAQTIDLPLWALQRQPRAIKLVGDQAWERCVRRGWIPQDMTIDDFQRHRGDARVRWQKRSRNRQLRAMQAVIVPSDYLKQLALQWGVHPQRLHIVHNALPLPALPRSQRDLRAALAWNDQPTLVTIARLQPWKGIDHLLSALADLPQLQLVIIGDGPDRQRLQALAAPLGERVRFTGQLPPQQTLQRLAAADALVLYSAYEGLSHTLLESLQLGTPVVASDKGGNRELIQHGRNGLLVPHVDIPALRAAILRLLAERQALAAQCRDSIRHIRFDTMVSQTDALLRAQLRMGSNRNK